MQASVPILPDDDQDKITKRILMFEHKIYPIAVKLIANKKVYLENKRKIVGILLMFIFHLFLLVRKVQH